MIDDSPDVRLRDRAPGRHPGKPRTVVVNVVVLLAARGFNFVIRRVG